MSLVLILMLVIIGVYLLYPIFYALTHSWLERRIEKWMKEQVKQINRS